MLGFQIWESSNRTHMIMPVFQTGSLPYPVSAQLAGKQDSSRDLANVTSRFQPLHDVDQHN